MAPQGHLSKRESGLLMLQVIHRMLRRSQLGNPDPTYKGKGTLDEIVMGCLRAAYQESLEGEGHLLPWVISNM